MTDPRKRVKFGLGSFQFHHDLRNPQGYDLRNPQGADMTAEIFDLVKSLVVQAQAPAGTYGFDAPIERHVVDITACLDGYRVWISGRPYKDFASLSNASRCASALTILDELGALPKEAS